MASAVAASVWDTPYISSDLLKKNITCITFGPPLVSVDIIQKVARRSPEIDTTIHAVFTEQDQIPSLIGLLDECWSEKAQTKSALGVQIQVASQKLVSYYSYTMAVSRCHGGGLYISTINYMYTYLSSLVLQPFEDQATFDLLQKFAKLQKEFHQPVR